MKRPILLILGLAVVVLASWLVYAFYPYLFAKDVQGQILKVERVLNGDLVIAPFMGGAAPPPGQTSAKRMDAGTQALYSVAVSVRDEKGEIHTASSEDRQWAVAEPGFCVEAKFYPYPPWQLDKSGTYFGARLLRLFDCKKK